MRARTASLVGLALLAALVLGAAHLFTEGALLSTAEHVWRVDVAADGPEPWRIEVPSLAARDRSGDALHALLAELRVERGNASFERDEVGLHVAGSGDASVVARRVFWGMQEAPFGGWHATGGHASRLDHDAPGEVYVTWSLDLVAGGGHTCGGEGRWTATLAPGAREPLTSWTMTAAGEQEVPLTTSAPPVMMWCN